MRLLTATRETQGQRDNDYSWAIVGELVEFGTECDGATADDACGCARGMAGMFSHKATTTFKVVELDISYDDLVATVRDSLSRGGWLVGLSAQQAENLARTSADELMRVGRSIQRWHGPRASRRHARRSVVLIEPGFAVSVAG